MNNILEFMRLPRRVASFRNATKNYSRRRGDGVNCPVIKTIRRTEVFSIMQRFCNDLADFSPLPVSTNQLALRFSSHLLPVETTFANVKCFSHIFPFFFLFLLPAQTLLRATLVDNLGKSPAFLVVRHFANFRKPRLKSRRDPSKEFEFEFEFEFSDDYLATE